MSRIGKNPIPIPPGVTVEITGNKVTIKGSKGELNREIHAKIKIEKGENELVLTRSDESKESKSLHGLTRKLVSNMVEGVSKGFEKKLEIAGVGYRAQANKNKINLTLGFSHPIEHVAPTDIEFEIEGDKKNIITVRGIDKEKVGEAAAKVRSYRKPEPYKGKGIRYVDEYVARKAGKSAASA